MYVVKRDGRREVVQFEKVQRRLENVSDGLDVNTILIAQRVLSRIYNGVKTSELDELAAQLAISLCTTHYDYGTLAARIAISNHQANTESSFVKVIEALANQIHPKTGEPLSYISSELLATVRTHGATIDARIDHERDFLFDYFGFKTLERAYLLKDSKGKILERPQHLWMRVALALWPENLERAFETYDLMSTKALTHATPTLFNAGTPNQQMSSCYLVAMRDDSIRGIYETLEQCALISKYAGGIGLHVSNIRAKGSLIRGTNGTSNGLVPMLRVFNSTARYVDQCFTPETIIWTLNGPKAIEDVSVTDKVLTSDGTYHKVMLPVRHQYKGELLTIRGEHCSEAVRVTPEHQVFAFKGTAGALTAGLARPEFHDARDLAVGDHLVYPIPQHEEDISQISEEDCRMYGILLGRGNISSTECDIWLHRQKADTIAFISNYLDNRGVRVERDETISDHVHLKWSATNPGFKLTKAQFYNGNYYNKNIDPGFLHLPIAKVKQIIRGLIESAGQWMKNKIFLMVEATKDRPIRGTWTVMGPSLRYLLLRLGVVAEATGINVIIPRVREIVEMFPDAREGNLYEFLRHDDRVYVPIKSIGQAEYDGVVHDFEIDGPHDYTVAQLGVAHNGGGRRNGSFAIYLEPWHADVEDFLRLKLNTGTEEERARDLFYALWMPDLFMERVEAGGNWTLFCPAEAPGLADVWGDEFKALYERYEAEGRGRKTIPAQDLWFQILGAQIETGTPYLVYKDAANRKSNQQNLGTIKSSNLCSEIIEYSSAEETAVCNLASIGLPFFVRDGRFDFDKLREVTAVAVRNLDKVIDINFYPTPETRLSNMRHRPVGLGVQGLADVFALLRLPWESEAAAELNQRIFEHMYYAAVQASAQAAREQGAYSTFAGSPASKGQLQPDLWKVTPRTEADGTLDWAALRRLASEGLRNSLLIAPMPTASTSQILGYNECFEPVTSNIYTRRTLAGEFIIVNKYLMRDLMNYGIWTEELKQKIIAQNGSVQGLTEIPNTLQNLYKTAWELKQRTLIDMAADRGAFICQSQSLNLFMSDANNAKLTSMHFYGWKRGLKTGIYYLRTRAPVMAQKFTVDPELQAAIVAQQRANEPEVCLTCSA